MMNSGRVTLLGVIIGGLALWVSIPGIEGNSTSGQRQSAWAGGTPPQEAAMDTVDMARIDSLKKRHRLWVGVDTTGSTVLWGGVERRYIGGVILSVTDTTGLNFGQYGFIVQACTKWERDSTCLYCMAAWLVDFPWDSLPPQVLGLHYSHSEDVEMNLENNWERGSHE